MEVTATVSTPHQGYHGKLLGLLVRIAREGLSGTLRLDARAPDPGAGCLALSSGRVVGILPGDGSPLIDARDLAAMRAGFAAMLRAVDPGRAVPEFRAESVAGASGSQGLSAADLALDLVRTFEDLEPLKRALLSQEERPITRTTVALACPPGPGLGPGERYVLSRADGAISRRGLLSASPAGEPATLKALYGLEALGMIGSVAATTGSGSQPHRASQLDSFLTKTASTASPAPPRTRPQYTPEQQQERDHIAQWLAGSAGRDAYAILGVTPSNSESEIRAAYYRLAKRYHPDHLRKGHLEDLLRNIEMMFAAMTEAYNTLGNPGARQEYDRARHEAAVGRQKSTSDPVAVAKDVYLRGRREMDAGHIFEAIRLFEAATQSDPSRFEYFHFLGVCQGQNPRWRKKAEENLLKAISMNPSAPQAYLELARIYHKGGLERRAVEMYDQALKWDPENQEALEALGRAGGKEGTSTGILRSIFGKD